MAEVKVFLPKLGESILSATVVQWFKEEGDWVEVDEPLLEVSTDKLTSELPSPAKGRIKKIYAQADRELNVGDLLAVIESEEKERETLKKEERVSEEEKEREVFKREEKPSEREKEKGGRCKAHNKEKIYLSPAAKILVEKNNISKEALEGIPPTGAGGRISRRDIENYLKSSKGDKAEGQEAEAIKMSPMRKTIAKNMIKAYQEIPSGSLIVEADVTNILKLIRDLKEDFFHKNGFKLTITSFLVRAVAKAMQDYPHINAALVDDTIYVKKEINLGVAVNIEQGLIVPVIKHCESKSITEIADALSSLGKKARNNTLSPEDIQGGTLTMTNFGMGGAIIGIPIIKYPEAAIIGVGAIVRKVVVLQDDSFAIRSIINVSLTFDHRIIDGMYGSNFMQKFKDYLENHALSDFS